ncbi:laccase-1-like [Lytechinus variegatus]|uniref:laccase-1-like n=1 Tax=Lytechinus variegatus TaxID=7654 RepID=UPI001BB0DE70|nr:laccase-1-like [Lytechinus variegatus]
MTCRYTFDIEWYSTMSRACFDCPCNQSDCERERCVAADGFRRPIVVANRQLPGPAIEVCKGDRIIVEVHNELDDAEGVSIHWHGLLQRNTPYMDGATLITQCPITPFSSFTYDFIADRTGTHWWHSHTGFQRANGLFGPLIVREPEADNPHSALYDYDLSEHTIMISDWSHETAVELFVLSHHAGEWITPPHILINGKAQLVGYTAESDGTSHATPREVFEVEEGKRYRFRLISTASSSEAFTVSVENHTLTIIASDGAYVQPQEVDALVIYEGERYDVVLNASQRNGFNYWMKFQELYGGPVVNHGLAIIRYSGARKENPSSSPSPTPEGIIYQKFNSPASADVLTVNELVAIENATLPQENKRTFYMKRDFNEFSDERYWDDVYSPMLNDRSFKLPSYSLLSEYHDETDGDDICLFEDEEMNERCKTEFCHCTQVLQVKINQTVEIVLVDEGKRFLVLHPFHLHGYSFRVLAQGFGGDHLSIEEVIKMDRNGTIKRNFDNPPEKDTVITTNAGYTVIQFIADNPGWWLFHCHNVFHLLTGMAIVVRAGDQADLPPLPDNFPRCGNFEPRERPPPPTRSTQRPPSPSHPPENMFPLSTVIGLSVVVGILGLLVIVLIIDAICRRQEPGAPSSSTANGGKKGQDAPWRDTID